jgi:methionyl-tRNA synthetase
MWSVAWKGLALWRAASLKQRNWFIGILLLNTLGILEIVYLFFFATKKMKIEELKFWEK